MNRATDDLISRASFRSNIQTVLNDNTCPIHIAAEIEQYLELEPAVDATPMVHGRWVHHNGGFSDHYDCTACGKAIVLTSMWAYCPLCGAKMEVKNA